MEPSYQLIFREGDFEIRAYPPLLLAETLIAADYRQAGGIGFQRLAGYIFGGNSRQENMAMTTPVLRQSEGVQWKMSFVMPQDYSLDKLPLPLDTTIALKQEAEKKIAVLRYSGSLDEKSIASHSQKLLNWLTKQSLKAISPTRSAAYDPPWTIPMLRRNEIHVDIE